MLIIEPIDESISGQSSLRCNELPRRRINLLTNDFLSPTAEDFIYEANNIGLKHFKCSPFCKVKKCGESNDNNNDNKYINNNNNSININATTTTAMTTTTTTTTAMTTTTMTTTTATTSTTSTQQQQQQHQRNNK